jgi:glutathione S-transferase
MSIPRLYHVTATGMHSRAFRCIWLLEELEVHDYEVCLLDPSQPYGPQMQSLGVKAAHKVPALEYGDQHISESGVISQFLAETYRDNRDLLGTPAERFDLLYWISMAETCITFRVPLLPKLMAQNKGLEELKAEALDPMRAVFNANVDHFESHFERSGSEFLMESGFSVADTMCGWSLSTFHGWGLMDLASERSPRTLAYLKRLRALPGFVAAAEYGEAKPGLYRRGCVPAT